MPSIPKFNINQDPNYIYMNINVPYVRISDMEFYIDQMDFTFYCRPYLLKLTFPYPLVDDERAKAVYNIEKDNGTITLSLPKEKPGQIFPDLDLTTKLLQKKEWNPLKDYKKQQMKPMIETIKPSKPGSSLNDNNNNHNNTNNINNINISNNNNTVKMSSNKQMIPTDTSLLKLENNKENIEIEKITIGPPRYGFNYSFSNFFTSWHGEIQEIVSIPNPDNIPENMRYKQRQENENYLFNPENYLNDFLYIKTDPYYESAISFTPFWMKTNKKDDLIENKLNNMSIHNNTYINNENNTLFTDKENELLQRLPNKEYLLYDYSNNEVKYILGGLVDIFIAYLYDYRFTQGDSTIESSWTISILSTTLSWLDCPSILNIKNILINSIRRILIFPYLKDYTLATYIINDCILLFKKGKRYILKCLLDMYSTFEKSETKYLLCTLYLQDYCIWIQSINDNILFDISNLLLNELKNIHKNDIGFNLLNLEKLVHDHNNNKEV